ncbi:MAG: alkaline phosphatase family protein [Thermoplasmata archaeon]
MPTPSAKGVPGSPTSSNPSLTDSAIPAFPTPIQHVIVVIDENQNYSTVLADGPYENYLAQTYATATNDYSIAHGSTHAYEGATSGDATNAWPLKVDNIGDLADAAGVSWDAFEQSMPSVCDKSLDWAAGYDNDHNPFIMYTDIANNAARCDAHDLTWSSWTTDVADNSIPNYAYITPNTTNDDHNGTSQLEEIRNGDAWLQSWLSPLINDSAIFSNTAFLITFDEDAGDKANTPTVDIRGQNASGGHIYMVVVSPYSKGLSSSTLYTTYSVLTTAEWLLGLPGGTLDNDSWTLNPPLESLFSFTNPSYTVTFKETGLPSGTPWAVTVGASTLRSTTASIEFSETDGTYTYNASVTGSGNTSGSFTVSGSKLTVPIAYQKVTFTEEGLPSGTSWSVSANDVVQSSTSNVVFYLVNGDYSYAVEAVAGYSPTPASGPLTVDGAAVDITVTFTPGFSVTFSESGLPSGLSWQVSVNGTPMSLTTNGSTDLLVFAEADGTFPYAIASVSGWNQTTLATTGDVVVDGANVTEPTIEYSPVTYAVVFSEDGLPSGLSWQVTLQGVPMGLTTDGGTDGLTFLEPNGSYAYSITDNSGWHQTSVPYSGNVVVNGASVVQPTASYTSVAYVLNFSETGLPSGLSWQVSVDGVPKQLTADGGTDTLTWSSLTNGSYPYSITAIPGWFESTLPSSGSVTVNGGTASIDGSGVGYEVTLAYSTEVTYSVSLVESSLPTGLNWSATLDAVLESGTTNGGTDSLTWTGLANGTYDYVVGSVSGYTAAPSSGLVPVNGGPANVMITFTGGGPTTYPVTFTETGLPSGSMWSVTLHGVLESSTDVSIAFTEPNGTYDYTVPTVSGFVVSPGSGSVSVAGAAKGVPVVFSPTAPTLYSVTFTETDLPSGTNWSVTLSGGSSETILGVRVDGDLSSLTHWSDGGSSVGFSASNGTYSYSIFAPGHSNTTGQIFVDGQAAAPVSVTFPSSPSSAPLLSTLDIVIIGVAAILVVIAGFGVLSRRRARPPPGPSPPTPMPPTTDIQPPVR